MTPALTLSPSKPPRSRNGSALPVMMRALRSPLAGRAHGLVGGDPVEDQASLIAAAHRLGLKALALEGPYDELSSLRLPVVVELDVGGGLEYGVLEEVDAANASVVHPRQGSLELARDEFCRQWTGKVVVLEREPRAEHEALQNLEEHGARLRWFAAAVALILAVMAVSWLGVLSDWIPERSHAAWIGVTALAAALAASLHAAFFGQSCPACHRAAALVGGMPLGTIGAASYTLLWIAALLFPHEPYALWGTAWAVGVHVVLLTLLARRRIACRTCIAVGASAFVALGFLAAGRADSFGTDPVQWLLLASSLVTTPGIVRLANLVMDWRWTADTSRLIDEIAANRTAVAAGKVELLVYRRRGCKTCAVFDSTLRPALEAEFSDTLTLTDLDVGSRKVPTPFLVLRGPVPWVIAGLPEENAHETIREAILAASSGEPRPTQHARNVVVVGRLGFLP